jgi:protein-tyrosine phosphatase
LTGAEGKFQTKVDTKQLITQITPSQGETVSTVTKEVESFLQGYALGKGLAAAETVTNDIFQPVTFSWECAKTNNGYTLRYTTMQDFSDVTEVSTVVPEIQVDSLFTGCTYYWQVVTHMSSGDNYSTVFSFHTAKTPRIIDINGVYNTRDFGGYMTTDGKHRVKQGMVYRGSQLDGIKQEGKTKALDVYGIKTELDLRREKEVLTDGSPLGNSVNYCNISVIDYNGAYSHPDEMRDAIGVFADAANYPIYVHCAVGRDRTGTLLFILGNLLGVQEESLYADYEITYLTPKSYKKGDTTGHDSFLSFLNKLNQYDGQTLQEKTQSYCKSIGVTQEQIDSIRSILLGTVE